MVSAFSKILPGISNHQTIVIGAEEDGKQYSVEPDSDGVRIVVNSCFGNCVLIALDCAAVEKIMKVWRQLDCSCSHLPF